MNSDSIEKKLQVTQLVHVHGSQILDPFSGSDGSIPSLNKEVLRSIFKSVLPTVTFPSGYIISVYLTS